MPKARVRRATRTENRRYTRTVARTNSSSTTTANAVNASVARRACTTRASDPLSLFMPAMVVLGCWGLAIFFSVFSADPNRLLFAGMAVLMALMWSFSLGLRLRKMMQRK
ncbi:MAG: hypothetical protein JO202_19645 [Ktedonobacteraceae bacterium]|nr:hypothetical protein [Ktedonobacteraceae bacterium]